MAVPMVHKNIHVKGPTHDAPLTGERRKPLAVSQSDVSAEFFFFFSTSLATKEGRKRSKP